jgi:cbb3-type cytochrome oxidase subunit 3
MSYFIFAGDMLVMLFMFCVVVWVFAWSPKEKVDKAARIPLEDEQDNG